MTNKMIIFEESVRLMEEGVIKGTGVFVKVADADGNEKEFEMPEELHTFQGWKKKGFIVNKGEHCVAKFPIWSYSGKKVVDEEGEEKESGHCFMRTAAWFVRGQVTEIAC